MQPSGNLHIGNYLGALKNWIKIQYDYETIFGIVDLHAITAYQNPAELQKKIEEIAAIYIASGIDPKHCTIFVQSAVPAHVELAWVLTCVTPVGWLTRMTQFKAKSEALDHQPSSEDPASGEHPSTAGRSSYGESASTYKRSTYQRRSYQRSSYGRLQQESIASGLLLYPVLMAADILLYNAAIVPVGEDQAQHLELTRDIAERFNSIYDETFVVPQTRLPSVGARVMGLDDPTIKMSKSTPGSFHSVGILDSPERIKKVIGRATTDGKPAVDFEDLSPGVANLLAIYQGFSGWSDDQMRSYFHEMRYSGLKREVTEMVVASLEPIQRKYREITSEPGYLRAILQEGAARASHIANATVELVKTKTGLYT